MPGTIATVTPPDHAHEPGRKNSKGLRLSIPRTLIVHEDEPLSGSPEPTSSQVLSIRKSRLYTVPEHTCEQREEGEEEMQTPKAGVSLNTRVDTLEINFINLTKRVEGLKRMLDDVGGDICGLGGTLDGMERRLGALNLAKR